MTIKTFLVKLADIPVKDDAGNPISDAIGSYLTKRTASHADLAEYALVAAHEVTVPENGITPPLPNYLRLFFQKK